MKRTEIATSDRQQRGRAASETNGSCSCSTIFALIHVSTAASRMRSFLSSITWQVRTSRSGDRSDTRSGDSPRRNSQMRGQMCELPSATHSRARGLVTCGCSSAAEPRPSKAMTPVRFRSPAPTNRGVPSRFEPTLSGVARSAGQRPARLRARPRPPSHGWASADGARASPRTTGRPRRSAPRRVIRCARSMPSAPPG